MEIWILGVAQKSGFFQTPFFLRVFEKIELAFFKTHFFAGFWKMGVGLFQKSEIFKISSSSHSKNAHIKLNGFQWVFCGWGDTPFIFFMGQMGQKSKNGPSRAPHPPVRAVYPPGVGLLVIDLLFKNNSNVVPFSSPDEIHIPSVLGNTVMLECRNSVRTVALAWQS